MINKNILFSLGLSFIDEYTFDSTHRSFAFKIDKTCIIIDDNICINNGDTYFDYSKYCEMQNKYMLEFDSLFRFNYVDNTIYDQIKKWITLTPSDIEITDDGGSFSAAHIDNSLLEKKFEDLFLDAYGSDAMPYLKKEYAISLNNGRLAFADYVVETKNGNYAIEENGVNYHHPCIIGTEKYEKQLEKQNTLMLYKFKTFRFSTQNLSFKDQIIDNIKTYLGKKEDFLNSNSIVTNRAFKLYEHQEKILEKIHLSRKSGINTSLVTIPTGTGKSQIVLEDLQYLLDKKEIKTVLIMVPSIPIKNDWVKRTRIFNKKLKIDIKFYNTVFIEKNSLAKDYYDYIVFDEAHHAQAANCKRTLQYFTPKYLIGLTATPERLDKKNLNEIFGQYETNFTLKEAIKRNIISNIRCYRLISSINLSDVRYNGKDYNYADLEKTLVVDSRNELIANTLKKYFLPHKDFYKQGIVFCVNIQHCLRLEKILNDIGIKAKAVYGSNKNNDDSIFEEYKNKKIQFLLSCQVISEGWDSPQTEIVVMARPTLSKVLYLQQMGRGVRKYPGKECLYVIDVVDNYEGKLTPWSFNSVFKISNYSDFAGVIHNNFDYLNILGLSEQEISMQEIDVFTFEEKYKGFRSLEQAARELFIGTSTLGKWVKNNPRYSSLSLPIGNKLMPYFSDADILNIKQDKKLKDHSEETILDDFIDFIDENTLTYSFKLIFLLSMFKLSDKEGNVNMDALIDEYSSFYKDRLDRRLQVDRKGCVYDYAFLNDRTKIKKSIIDNPFEKFERKRFIYFSKDLNILSFNPNLWAKLTKEIKESLINKEKEFLKEYYKDMGGL